MKDQAEALRKRLQIKSNRQNSKSIAVVSGKGGVGKSNFSLNFAISLSKRGHKVLLFDMDIGMGNIDILLGNQAKCSISDFFDGKETLSNLISEGPEQLHYIAGGSGLERLITIDDDTFSSFSDELSSIMDNYQYIIFDMGAGVTKESLSFILSVDEIIVVTTPEPTSITDAYSMMKHIHIQNQDIPFLIVVNRVLDDRDGINTYKRLKEVSKRFLGRDLNALGVIPDDRSILKAVTSQTPFILKDVRSDASKAIIRITERYETQLLKEMPATNAFHFVTKLKRFLFER
ncbi:MinD/ParA family protein [Bacillus dakarensis]|uniref:MinD/ParA family protein n=1 Tax=Robertmurraya dakarensis TaxID=1926278 RepID=UPI00098107B1|nr:MinD/ParA family protein [Bacillus dakarensis]